MLGLLLAFGVLASTGLGCTRDDPKEAIPNVRLGMAPRDVRDRFPLGGEGSWQTALGTGDDTVLEWTSRNPKSAVLHARFEFHLGMLVAIRATTSEPLSSEKIALTPKTVTVRAPHEGGTAVTVLARDCPTHKDEADAFAARSR
jgi:hypothetical protein